MPDEQEVHIPDWFEVNLDRVRAEVRSRSLTIQDVVQAVGGTPSHGTIHKMLQEPTDEERQTGTYYTPNWVHVVRVANALGIGTVEPAYRLNGGEIIPEVGVVAADSRMPSLSDIEVPDAENIVIPHGLESHRVMGHSAGNIVWPGQRVLTVAADVEDGDLVYIEFKDTTKVPVFKRYSTVGTTVVLASVDSDEPLMKVKRSDIRRVRKVVGAWYV